MQADVTVPTTFFVIAVLALAAQALVLIVALFGPGLRYRIDHADLRDTPPADFLRSLEAVADARLSRRTALDVFTNGEEFYPAQLEAIARAERSVHLEAYIFYPGQVGSRFIEALAARARAGVEVRLVLDGVGSARTRLGDFDSLTEAGGRVAFYHPLRFVTLPRYNHRTHREILVVDGAVGFVGGAGFADHWLISTPDRRRWRDTVVRLEGSAVNNLQATFAENWLEACGELLAGERHFPAVEAGGDSPAMVVNSTPSAGGSTRARVLFQLLIASARKTVHATTPYFLPDHGISDELARAAARGADVRVLVPGRHADHLLTRSSSRMAYGRLLSRGVRIFEYGPGMIHAKVLIVDGEWSVVGSTNFDNRSFGLNDEVNLAVCDPRFSERLERDFSHDLADSREISYAEWKGRSLFERGPELLGWIFERQQ
jgi:cardiolipin synthase A/B